MGCALHPDGDCPMQRLADHAVNCVPIGLSVVCIVVEQNANPAVDMHASLATRTRGIDVADLLRKFADDVDGKAAQRDATQAYTGDNVGRIRADAPPAAVRKHLEEAVSRGANTVVMDPRALLRLMNASIS